MTVRVRIEGLREVQEALRTLLPDRKARTVIRKILRDRLKPIAARASDLAPVGPSNTKHLKNSIAVSGTLRRSQRDRSKNPNDITVYAGPSTKYSNAVLHYAHLQEFGAPQHGPQAYMRPAWDEHKSGMIRNIGQDVWKEIEKTVQRSARKALKKAGRL